MKVKINKSRAFGEVFAPPSKSVAHRLLICAALSEGESRIEGISECEDVCATIDCLKNLGAEITLCDSCALVKGIIATAAKPNEKFNCRESGSTMRFLIPTATLSGSEVYFTGADGLMRRPLSVYEKIYTDRGLEFIKEGTAVRVKGALPSGDYSLPGNVSSQFISGLMFALPLTSGDSRITVSEPFESRSYIDLTIEAERAFGIDIGFADKNVIEIKGNSTYKAQNITVEGDYSGAAFCDAFNYIGGDVRVLGLKENSAQGDRVYKKYFDALRDGYSVLDISDCPDLGPILFALAAALDGGRFTGTARLKIKESDRAAAMAEELSKLGVSVTVSENEIEILKSEITPPITSLDGHNDHRIVMALAVLLTLVGGEIDGAEAVRKSYPDFFRDISDLGIGVEFYE